jgi:hypothetical protein
MQKQSQDSTKLVSHLHINSAHQGCFLETVPAASAKTLVSRNAFFSEQSHVGQNNNLIGGSIPMQSTLLPALSYFSLYL